MKATHKPKMKLNLCNITTSLSDVWTAQFIALSDWLVEGSAGPMTKEMGNGHGVDLTWWVSMPPLISSIDIPPRTLEGGVGVGRQLKVTARCHSTVQSHYTSCRLSSCSPSSHDGQMTITPSLLFQSVSSSLGYMCSWDSVPIYVIKKCQTILLVKVSSYIFGIKTFTNLMKINDCILFSTIPKFHLFFWPWNSFNCSVLAISAADL